MGFKPDIVNVSRPTHERRVFGQDRPSPMERRATKEIRAIEAVSGIEMAIEDGRRRVDARQIENVWRLGETTAFEALKFSAHQERVSARFPSMELDMSYVGNVCLALSLEVIQRHARGER